MVARKRKTQINKQQTTHTHTHTLYNYDNYNKLRKWQKALSELLYLVINF